MHILKSRILLTDTGGEFLWRPVTGGLTETLGFANQLIALAAMVGDATSKCIAFAGVPTMGWVLWLT